MSDPPSSETRGTRGRGFTLLTPAARSPSRLPSFPGAQIFKLVTPRLAPARFAQWLLELPSEPFVTEVSEGFENFFFALDGATRMRWTGRTITLEARGYAYIPAGMPFVLESVPASSSRLLWIKRRYEPWPGLAHPVAFSGRAADATAEATATQGLRRRELLASTDARFDFNVSLMSFLPGISLPGIEMHEEEHGIYMTAGDGAYHLDGAEHEVRDSDFVYTAPYCPQGFRAGTEGAEYLLYSEVWRNSP